VNDSQATAHFAVKSISLSKIGGRKPCTLLQAARHNLREIQAELGAQGHINPARSPDNQVLEGPGTGAEVQALADGLMTPCGPQKLRRDHCQALEVLFSLSPNSPIQPGPYFQNCLAWLKQVLGLPVLSAVLHTDEAAPHMHVLLLPVKANKHVGSQPIERAELKRLRTSFFDQVAGPAGLQRQQAKLYGATKQRAVAVVLFSCEERGLPAHLGALWHLLKAAIEREPLVALQALAIDPAALSPTAPVDAQTAAQKRYAPKPIGFADQQAQAETALCKPIGFETTPIETQTLSCVGFVAAQTPGAHDAPPRRLYQAPAQHTAVVPQTWVLPHARRERLERAQEVQRQVLIRQRKQVLPIEQPSAKGRDGEAWVREQDDHVHDLSAWD
jgi:hypothetical protein